MRASKKINSVHPKLIQLYKVIKYFVEFHSLDKKKPNRRFRRLIEKGVKIGKNRPASPHKIVNGSLSRKRVSFY